jgi:hypothetical protein
MSKARRTIATWLIEGLDFDGRTPDEIKEYLDKYIKAFPGYDRYVVESVSNGDYDHPARELVLVGRRQENDEEYNERRGKEMAREQEQLQFLKVAFAT